MKLGWIEIPLKEVVMQSKEKHKSEKVERLFYVGLEHIMKNNGELTKGVGCEEIRTIKNVFRIGQLLYGKLRPYLNKVHLARRDGVCSTDILVFDICPNVVSEYLLYIFLSRGFVNDMSENTNGVNLPRVSTKYILDYKIFLPPLPEQRAIVSKIEQLFSELDHGIANLKAAKDKLEIYRQAVLKKAFEGELTKEWREQQTDLPTANELLEQIREERFKHYENQITEWEEAVEKWEKSGKQGKKPSKPSRPKTFKAVTNEEVEPYGNIPRQWFWTRLGDTTKKIGDVDHKMPKDAANGVPYLSTGNIRENGFLDFENAKIISEEDYLRLSLKIKPEKGDIIFPRYGTIGRNVLVKTNERFLVSYSCAIVKTISSISNEKFILYYTLSPVIKKEIKRYTVQTTQANIGIASIELFVYPLCSKAEQTQIVNEIESRLSVCDNVLANIEEGLEKSEALRQSVLKKAFEGRLLSEAEVEACKKEPDWEPAEKLVERINQSRKSA